MEMGNNSSLNNPPCDYCAPHAEEQRGDRAGSCCHHPCQSSVRSRRQGRLIGSRSSKLATQSTCLVGSPSKSRPIDSPCECEHNNPDSLEARQLTRQRRCFVHGHSRRDS